MKSKSGLFLMELMFCIFFFAIGSAVCLQMFVKAHTVSESSRDLTFATEICSTVSDHWKDSQGDYDLLLDLLLTGEYTDNVFTIYYTEEGENCEEADAFYTLHLTTTYDKSSMIMNGHFEVEHQDQLVYETDIEHFEKEAPNE